MRPALMLALLASGLAGCLGAPAPVEPSELLVAPVSLPWLENWSTVGGDLSVDYDPDARRLAGEGSLMLRNDLGEERPSAVLYLEPYRILGLEDEDGRSLPYETTAATLPAAALPEGLRNGFADIQAINVTLGAPAGPGAVRTLRIAYEGWGGRYVNVPGGPPSELGYNMHLWPVPSTTVRPADASTRVSITYPGAWVVAATGQLLDRSEEEGRAKDAYAGPHLLYSAQGLEWTEDDVGGVEVRTYFFPYEREGGRRAHDVTLRVLREMPALTGPYPTGHAWTVPYQRARPVLDPLSDDASPGWAFNACGIVGSTPDGYSGKPGDRLLVFVHERTHEWWGCNLAENNTDLRLGTNDAWVGEGITRYLTDIVWVERHYGPEEAASGARSKVADYERFGIVLGALRGRGLGGVASDEYGWTKADLALRALEAYAIQSGRPDAVLDALKLLQDRYGRLRGGPGLVGTHDALAVFEEVFGEDLSWHFEPWFFGSDQADFTVRGVVASADDVTVAVANVGKVSAAVQVRAVTLSGRELWAWGFAGAGAAADVVLLWPPGALPEPVVRAEADPRQYVWESDEGNNVWVGAAGGP